MTNKTLVRNVVLVVGVMALVACGKSDKVLDAEPLSLEPDSQKFDVAGRGKTRLPFARIEAVSVAAVSQPTRPRKRTAASAVKSREVIESWVR